MMGRLSLFILFSFFLHVAALLSVPDFFKPAKIALIPVSLMEAVDLYLEPAEPTKPPEVKTVEESVGLPESTAVQKIRHEVVLRRLSEMGLSEKGEPPVPKSGLFPAKKLDEQEKIRILKASRFYHELEEIMRNEERRGKVYHAPRATKENVKGGSPPLPEDLETKRIIAGLKEVSTEPERVERIVPETVTLGIKGPVASRSVLYVPPPPKVKVSVEADVLLKFWVLPDGTVGKVIPLVKGDAEVDLAATNHIKRYRFNPLPKDVPQVQMWGAISVRTVLR